MVTRRKLFGAAAAASCVLTSQAAETDSHSISARPERKLKVVVTGGHPGDPEYGCGGTVARYTRSGHQVVLLYLNQGDTSCEATSSNKPKPRVLEAQAASRILGATAQFAGQCDGHAVVDAAHYEEFRMLLQAEQPDVVFAHWPVDHHRDHRAMSMLVYDAWLESGKKFGLYYYEVSSGEDTQMFSPTHYVNISAVEPTKRSACYAHASQSPDHFYSLQQQIARFRGIEAGCTQAEAFIHHVQSPDNLLPV